MGIFSYLQKWNQQVERSDNMYLVTPFGNGVGVFSQSSNFAKPPSGVGIYATLEFPCVPLICRENVLFLKSLFVTALFAFLV
jgi:hypothetical protein